MLSKLSAFVAGSLLALGVGSSGAGQVVSPRADMQHVLGEPAPWIVQVQGVLEDQFADHEKSSASQDATDSEDAAVCSGERDVIVDLADRIIALGLASNRTKERRFGTWAAYLKLRYQQMELAEGMALLDRVTGDFATLPTHIDDLRLAFAVHHQEVDVGLTATGTSALRAFSAYRYSVVRQIILADAGQSFFRLMAGSGSIQSWEPSSTGLI